MKKLFLLTVFTVFAFFLSAQTLYLNETFDNAEWPEGWEPMPGWHHSPTVEVIRVVNTNNAGGTPREVEFRYLPSSPAMQGNYGRLLSPPLPVNIPSSVMLEFIYSTQIHEMAGTDPIIVGVGTTTNNGVTWNTLWEKTHDERVTEANPQPILFNLYEEVESPDFGEENCRLVFYFYCEDAGFVIRYWAFDNIRLFTQVEYDASLLSIDGINNATTQGKNEVGFTFINKGVKTITSLEADYQFDGMPKITQVFTSLSVAQNEELSLTFDEKTILEIGDHVLDVNITKINGQEDEEPADNSKTMNTHAYMALGEKRLVIDYFSSSTCTACPNSNVEMKAFVELYPNQTVISKYTVPVPVAGDPYVNADAAMRRAYYNTNTAPSVYYNGTSILSGYYEDYFLRYFPEQVPIVEVRGNFKVEDTKIKIDFNIAAYEDLTDAVVHVAVNEKHTTGNASTNGETDFYHTMMKMLPDGNGTPTNFNRYEVKNFTFEYDMVTTHIEEMDDLEVNVFIQNKTTKEIFNGNWLLEKSNLENEPPSNLILNEYGIKNSENTIHVTWIAPENDKVTGYNVYINDKKVADNINNTDYWCEIQHGNNELDVVKVSAVYPNNVESVRIAEYITTFHPGVKQYDENNVKLFPNPAAQNFTLSSDKNMKKIEIINMVGQVMDVVHLNHLNCMVKVENYNSGIYFVKIIFDDGSCANRKVVVK
jgi:hypothetical protein